MHEPAILISLLASLASSAADGKLTASVTGQLCVR
jgi:hypothetical protein